MLPRAFVRTAWGGDPRADSMRFMGSLNGYLDLGTAVTGNEVTTPPSFANYHSQPISFDVVNEGTLVSNTLCIFGPVSGTWGTLTSLGISDLNHNPLFAGLASAALVTENGLLIQIPPGAVSIVPSPGPPFQVSGGFIVAPTNPGLPTSSGSLWPGAVWWAGGASGLIGIVPGVTPNPLAPPTYLANISPTYLLIYGAGYLPLSNPGAGSLELWNNSGFMAQA